MKNVFLCILFFYSVSAFAQTERLVAGNDKSTDGQKLRKAMAGITDKNIYDADGNILDSATATKMLRTYEYYALFSIPKGQTELKRTVTKIDPIKQAELDTYVKSANHPKSTKLWDGVVLDLSHFSKRFDIEKLKGKAVVLIFWCSKCYARPGDAYNEINNVISNYIGQGKFEVLAITHQPYDEATLALKKNPILNARQIIDAPGITDFYETDNKPIIVVTNKEHQITYAINEWANMTPRMMNNLLKNL